jgi:hypothetical protein
VRDGRGRGQVDRPRTAGRSCCRCSQSSAPRASSGTGRSRSLFARRRMPLFRRRRLIHRPVTVGDRRTKKERDVSSNGKIVINLATGLEDPERVTLAFLVADAGAEAGKQVTMFLSKESVRLALPGVAQGIACDGCRRCRRSRRSTPTLTDGCLSARSVSTAESSAGRADRRCAARRRHPAVKMDRRRRHRLQPLNTDMAGH